MKRLNRGKSIGSFLGGEGKGEDDFLCQMLALIPTLEEGKGINSYLPVPV